MGARSFIGAKGSLVCQPKPAVVQNRPRIGFKSVFRVSETPAVHSGRFHFHFDARALGGLGYLVPFPLPAPPLEGLTRLVLPLSGTARVAEVRKHLKQVAWQGIFEA